MALSASAKARVREVLRHRDVLGAGAAQRRALLHGPEKIHAVLSEFKRGTLHSGSGEKVTDRQQALAIALSEARRHGARV